MEDANTPFLRSLADPESFIGCLVEALRVDALQDPDSIQIVIRLPRKAIVAAFDVAGIPNPTREAISETMAFIRAAVLRYLGSSDLDRLPNSSSVKGPARAALLSHLTGELRRLFESPRGGRQPTPIADGTIAEFCARRDELRPLWTRANSLWEDNHADADWQGMIRKLDAFRELSKESREIASKLIRSVPSRQAADLAADHAFAELKLAASGLSVETLIKRCGKKRGHPGESE